ncbi:MAG TPA: hypothetical protein VEH27_12910 [Methylomirabilota bacterium]|nr:hypothetical protein [Methylomirabilota bacterium]
MIDWNIQARAHGCQACNQPFTDKQPFHTLLFDVKQGYDRLDICQKCWENQHSQGAMDRKGFVSHWQSQYNAPVANAPDAIQKDTAEGLLRKLMSNNDPAHAGARFILAVMLERKRILKVKAQLTQGSQRVFLYEHSKTGELFHVPDPDLRLDQLTEVQTDVASLLERGFEPSTSGEGQNTERAGDESGTASKQEAGAGAAP